MRTLISGGFGFVGGRLAQHLHQTGHQIILGSRTVKSPPNWLPGSEVVKMDWDDHNTLLTACSGCDAIIHAAGVNARDSATNPAEALAINGVGTALLLDAAIEANVSRFIYLSTAHVYGSPLAGTITEEICPHNLHPYATSHLAGELAVLYATQSKQIDGVVLRLSNIFGAPTHAEANCWMLLVNDLCRQVVETGQMVLHTSGTQLRDFVPMKYVNDIFQNLLMRHEKWGMNSAINLGAGYSMSVNEMAKLIQQRCLHIIGKLPQIHRSNIIDTEAPQNLKFNTSKLASVMNTPSIIMESEIDELLNFCMEAFLYSPPPPVHENAYKSTHFCGYTFIQTGSFNRTNLAVSYRPNL